MRWLVCISLLTLTSTGLGCNGKGPTTTTGGTGNGPDDPAACAKVRDHARQLYRDELGRQAKPDDSPEAVALREQEVEDNTDMIMADCLKAPARFAPCIEKATSVDTLERDCVIPLDDQGAVEGDYFRARSPKP